MTVSAGKSGTKRHANFEQSGSWDAIAWIHEAITAHESTAILQQVSRDITAGRPPQLITSADREQFTAAAYFRLLSGNVASLGGMRAEPGYEAECLCLLEELTNQLAGHGRMLIQAIVDATDVKQATLLAASGYVEHTQVQQLWFDLANGGQDSSELPVDYRWKSATGHAPDELIEVISSTFVETLDCPILNEIRSPEDVLSGFAEDRELAQIDDWYLVNRRRDDTYVGCLFLSQHSAEVVELVYLGLHPDVRGKRLGATLILKAINTARALGAKLLVAGVDDKNWPALRAYRQLGFRVHQSKSVYFRAADVGLSHAGLRDV